jgi:hypothetical protein
MAGFTVHGQKVPSVETNFAGERQVSPRFKVVVQINHDTEQTHDFELTFVDDIFQALLTDYRRDPFLPNDFLTVVIITEVKMRRFYEGPKRYLFRLLAREMETHPDIYLSPTAIFISEQTLGDERRLRAALYQGLGYLFNQEFYNAMAGLMTRGLPVPYPHD